MSEQTGFSPAFNCYRDAFYQAERGGEIDSILDAAPEDLLAEMVSHPGFLGWMAAAAQGKGEAYERAQKLLNNEVQRLEERQKVSCEDESIFAVTFLNELVNANWGLRAIQKEFVEGRMIQHYPLPRVFINRFLSPDYTAKNEHVDADSATVQLIQMVNYLDQRETGQVVYVSGNGSAHGDLDGFYVYSIEKDVDGELKGTAYLLPEITEKEKQVLLRGLEVKEDSRGVEYWQFQGSKGDVDGGKLVSLVSEVTDGRVDEQLQLRFPPEYFTDRDRVEERLNRDDAVFSPEVGDGFTQLGDPQLVAWLATQGVNDEFGGDLGNYHSDDIVQFSSTFHLTNLGMESLDASDKNGGDGFEGTTGQVAVGLIPGSFGANREEMRIRDKVDRGGGGDSGGGVSSGGGSEPSGSYPDLRVSVHRTRAEHSVVRESTTLSPHVWKRIQESLVGDQKLVAGEFTRDSRPAFTNDGGGVEGGNGSIGVDNGANIDGLEDMGVGEKIYVIKEEVVFSDVSVVGRNLNSSDGLQKREMEEVERIFVNGETEEAVQLTAGVGEDEGLHRKRLWEEDALENEATSVSSSEERVGENYAVTRVLRLEKLDSQRMFANELPNLIEIKEQDFVWDVKSKMMVPQRFLVAAVARLASSRLANRVADWAMGFVSAQTAVKKITFKKMHYGFVFQSAVFSLIEQLDIAIKTLEIQRQKRIVIPKKKIYVVKNNVETVNNNQASWKDVIVSVGSNDGGIKFGRFGRLRLGTKLINADKYRRPIRTEEQAGFFGLTERNFEAAQQFFCYV